MEILEKLPDNIKEHIKKGGKDILDGYIRFLDKNSIEEIKAILEKSPMWEGGIPFATTVFADVFVWNKEYILLYKFTEADYNVILSGSKFFFANVDDIEYQKDFFDVDLYVMAAGKIGRVASTECYTIEPIPALGGARELSFINTGDMKTYLDIVISFG